MGQGAHRASLLTGQPTDAQAPSNTWVYMLAGIVLCVQGVAFLFMQPLFIGAIAREYGIDEGSVGFITFPTQIGGALAVVSLAVIVNRLDRRRLAWWALGFCAVANVASIAAHSLVALAIWRFIDGVAGSVLLGLGYGFVGAAHQPDKAYGWNNTAQVLFQAVILFGLPRVHVIAESVASYLIVLALVPASVWAIRRLPRRIEAPLAISPSAGRGARRLPAAPLIALLSYGVFSFFYQPIYTFAEQLGQRANMSAEEVGAVLSVTTLLGVGGSLASSWAGARFGRILPLLIGSLMGLMSAIIAWGSTGALGYWLGMTLFSLTWSINGTYLLGVLSATDPPGRFTITSQTIGNTATSIAIIACSFLLRGHGSVSIPVVTGAAIILSFALALVANHLTPPDRRTDHA